ncbi:hypothetical protein AB0892_23575 [Streptomyces sp. NPDC005409]|uniref:hypothetical protein n=1 Tax=Streptomyces sp. NPDC005409 TaxID=3155342 RepID=UPI003452E3DE
MTPPKPSLSAIIGTLARAQLLVLGRYDYQGRLRTATLRPAQARHVCGHPTVAAPGHP